MRLEFIFSQHPIRTSVFAARLRAWISLSIRIMLQFMAIKITRAAKCPRAEVARDTGTRNSDSSNSSSSSSWRRDWQETVLGARSTTTWDIHLKVEADVDGLEILDVASSKGNVRLSIEVMCIRGSAEVNEVKEVLVGRTAILLTHVIADSKCRAVTLGIGVDCRS